MLDLDAWFYWNSVDCSEEQLESAHYSCAYNTFGTSLDAQLTRYVTTSDAQAANPSTRINVPATQDLLSYAANATWFPTGAESAGKLPSGRRLLVAIPSNRFKYQYVRSKA